MKKNNFDLILFISVILISIFGVIMIYSSSSIWAEYKFDDQFRYLKLQSLFLFIGIILMYISMGAMINLPVPEIIDMNKNPIIYTIFQ